MTAHPVWALIERAIDDGGDDMRNQKAGPTLIAAALLEVRDAIVASNKPAHYESGPIMAQTAAAFSPAVALALLDRLERAESAVARRDVVAGGGFERREPASREAGEIVEAVLGAVGYDASEEAPYRVGVASRIVQRALDAAEERGAGPGYARAGGFLVPVLTPEQDAALEKAMSAGYAEFVSRDDDDGHPALTPVDTAARAYVAARAASLASNDADLHAALIAATDALVAAVEAAS